MYYTHSTEICSGSIHAYDNVQETNGDGHKDDSDKDYNDYNEDDNSNDDDDNEYDGNSNDDDDGDDVSIPGE